MFSANHEVVFSKLPRKVKINSVIFDIIVLDSESTMLTTGPLGMTNQDNAEITVRLTGNISQDVNTVIHEIMHGIFYQQDIPNSPQSQEREDDDFEEPMVIGMANGFMSVYYDNPKLVKWLNAARKEVLDELN